MITPNKHTKIKFSVLYVAGIMLKAIKQNGIITYNELKNFTTQNLGKEAGEIFPQSLSFLYLMNKIDYKKEMDSFIYTEIS
jgi:hypothetical protein